MPPCVVSPEPSPETPRPAEEVPVRGEMIRLGQLLKLAGVVDGGGEAKVLLSESAVSVNGEPESRRGRQLHPGDTVRVGGTELLVVSERRAARS